MWHVLSDTFLESLLMLPFLFGAYLLIEFLEHRGGAGLQRLLGRARRWSVPLGAVLGCVPQCGFSVAAANLYAGGIITMGTLAAVFLSTSDEALLILIGAPEGVATVSLLLGVKVLYAIVMGYLLDLLLYRGHIPLHSLQEDLCATCGCHDHDHGHHHRHGIVRPALKHTLGLFVFLLLISTLVHWAVHELGEERLGQLLLSGSVAQPLLAALVGFIPNCAVSVLLCELYTAGSISFGALAAGLCSAAGMGLAVLLRVHRHWKQNLILIGYLYLSAALLGMVLQLLGIG